MSEVPLMFFSYWSRVNCPAAEIDSIISQSFRRNSSAKMTGALVHDDTSFLQFLEGPRTAAAETILRILGDGRHDQIRILISEPTQVRLFSNWHMKRLRLTGQGKTLADQVSHILKVPQADRGFLLRSLALELEQQDA